MQPELNRSKIWTWNCQRSFCFFFPHHITELQHIFSLLCRLQIKLPLDSLPDHGNPLDKVITIQQIFQSLCASIIFMSIHFLMGFLQSSVAKESACNEGDPGLIPGSGRPSPGVGYPLQYSWASPVAQLVKNPPAVWETWVQSPGWEDPLEKGKATHSSILAWKSPWTV